ncbi:MAG: hypothetical protein PUD79_00535 [Prevotellaceae bacterium]|nr:hypothetical protein [Prevotellaceae bacterium]
MSELITNTMNATHRFLDQEVGRFLLTKDYRTSHSHIGEEIEDWTYFDDDFEDDDFEDEWDDDDDD